MGMPRNKSSLGPDTPRLIVVRNLAGLKARITAWRQKGERVAIVPTMGALHDGHLSLVKIARAHADRVIVSVFVNPKQFGPREDLSRYPRDEAGDAAKLDTVGADLMFAPEALEMYPQGFCTSIALSGITDVLCGAVRPGHFDGVATVVTKLFMQTGADVAVFGEKDYQQLCVIRRLVRDLDLPIEIIAGETTRESDGLAMSSRNAYLSAHDRAVAGQLNGLLKKAATRLAKGDAVGRVCAEASEQILNAGFATLDYLEVRHADTLALLGPEPLSGQPARVFFAGWVGKTRLIDNWAVTTNP